MLNSDDACLLSFQELVHKRSRSIDMMRLWECRAGHACAGELFLQGGSTSGLKLEVNSLLLSKMV